MTSNNPEAPFYMCAEYWDGHTFESAPDLSFSAVKSVKDASKFAKAVLEEHLARPHMALDTFRTGDIYNPEIQSIGQVVLFDRELAFVGEVDKEYEPGPTYTEHPRPDLELNVGFLNNLYRSENTYYLRDLLLGVVVGGRGDANAFLTMSLRDLVRNKGSLKNTKLAEPGNAMHVGEVFRVASPDAISLVRTNRLEISARGDSNNKPKEKELPRPIQKLVERLGSIVTPRVLPQAT